MSCFTPAEQAVMHLVKRITVDPRLAYLIGPGSESFDLIKAAACHLVGEKGASHRESFLAGVKTQPLPRIGDECITVDAELLHRMSLINDGVLDLDELVNHFIGLGLEAEEARRDSQTEELF
jgi:hypothetical protein